MIQLTRDRQQYEELGGKAWPLSGRLRPNLKSAGGRSTADIRYLTTTWRLLMLLQHPLFVQDFNSVELALLTSAADAREASP
jgi:hypothetical protein